MKRRIIRGTTLAEVVMALAVIGTMGGGCYVGFNALNAYAVSSRLYSEAQTCAQNQIDLILSKEPFDRRKIVAGVTGKTSGHRRRPASRDSAVSHSRSA